MSEQQDKERPQPDRLRIEKVDSSKLNIYRQPGEPEAEENCVSVTLIRDENGFVRAVD